jgi:hypothetical protein
MSRARSRTPSWIERSTLRCDWVGQHRGLGVQRRSLSCRNGSDRGRLPAVLLSQRVPSAGTAIAFCRRGRCNSREGDRGLIDQHEVKGRPADDAWQRRRGPRPAHRMVSGLPPSGRVRPRRDGRAVRPETTVPDWRWRLICSQCGSRQVDMVVTGTDRR